MSRKAENNKSDVERDHAKKLKGRVDMTRKQLEDMGLGKEQIDAILDANSQDIGKAKADYDTVKKAGDDYAAQIEALKKQLTDRDGQLEALKTSTATLDDLKKQIETLQGENKQKDDQYAAEILKIKTDGAIDAAITAAKAKNAKAVKALLDMEAIKLEDGEIKGVSEQLEKIKQENDYLFEAEKEGAKPQFTTSSKGDDGALTDPFMRGFDAAVGKSKGD